MKKILGLIALVFSILVLTACSTSTVDSLEGEYARLVTASNTRETELYRSEDNPMVIKGATASIPGIDDNLAVDTERKIFIGSSYKYPYVYEDGILQVNGDTYYKIGSKAYEEKGKRPITRYIEKAPKSCRLWNLFLFTS
ncbi:hypothetical protein ACJBZ3_04525, partial [Streptococcus suis]